ncbi:unnamed protein product [Adineta ricciae]|uniref:C-type lectin domain-containing protein n=1 Tax=Adineta ricciae TaxID=249248 RepID=A0A815DFC6_ADIRI|nr:unnamed protein product [Adineta ricciae]CAF1297599.1 unnamed protein product [Adineta ricciae]
MRFLLVLILVSLSSSTEHWFVFDRYQFPGFYTSLFTLLSSPVNQTNLSFALSSYQHSITIQLNQNKQTIQLSIERADLLSNTFNHLIFLAVRQSMKVESYVNCKLMDSYLFYSTDFIDQKLTFEVHDLAEGIQHIQLAPEDDYQRDIFEKFSCRMQSTENKTNVIGKPLIRKIQQVIEKVQQQPRRHSDPNSSLQLSTDSLTIVYKPDITPKEDNNTNFQTILYIPQFQFFIRYFPRERLFHIRFDNKNRTQFLLYVDKSADLLRSDGASQDVSSTTMIFLRITPRRITCYVNCELTDQEFILDTFYVRNILRQLMTKTISYQQYDQQSTLILFNKTMTDIATMFSCSKLDEKQDDSLPDKYALRKFVNALDVLVNNLESSVLTNNQTILTTTPSQNVSAIDIHSINGFGSLKLPLSNTVANDVQLYGKSCLTDDDCNLNNASLKCRNDRCTCAIRWFWSTNSSRCLSCKDLSIGSRCFRLSNHKSSWMETIDFCRDDNSLDGQSDYSMKLVSNLNLTDIELLKTSLIEEDDGEQLDYFYWIGLTNQIDMPKQRVTSASTPKDFYWFDTGKVAQLNKSDLWCSQREETTNDTNRICVTLTSCGLYADDCQRNYRFLCEAI